MYDLIIRNGFLIDGGANPGYHADIAIKDGKIACIARPLQGESQNEIDARGLTVTPGFIDSHSHSDLVLENYAHSRHKLEQGVTTEIVGMCGFSCAPISDAQKEEGIRTIKALMPNGYPKDNAHLKTFSDYMEHMQHLGFGPNIAGYIGHNTIRVAVMGFENRDPTEQELEQMKAYVEDAMRAGALGISLGLYYTPGIYSKTQESIELCRVAAKYGGTLSLHMRYEDDRLLEGVEEVLHIVRETGIKAVISHHKAAGLPSCWGLPEKSLAMIEQANQSGMDIFLDQYPYTATSTLLKAILPGSLCTLGNAALLEALKDPAGRAALKKEALSAAPAEEAFFGTMIASSVSHPALIGKRLLEEAKRLEQDPYDLCFEMLLGDDLGTSICNWRMSEQDVQLIMQDARTMIGTDGLMYPDCVNCHPRAFGTFPRVLGHYVRQTRTLTLVDAVRKMTGLPSMVYGLDTKGLLRVGMDADITIFDADTILDRANFSDCFARCEGLRYVLVGGNLVVKDARYLGGLHGTMMRAGSQA